MNVLVVAPYAAPSVHAFHMGTELEIIQTHLGLGDDVTLLGCYAELLSCDVNSTHDLAVCLECIGRRLRGRSLVSRRIAVKPLCFLTERDRQELRSAKTSFSTVAELEAVCIDNFDIGFGVLSSLVDHLGDADPDLSQHRRFVGLFMISALAVYRSIQNYVSSLSIDRVYVHNGRLAPLRAVLRACQSKGVDCLIYETGCTLNHYSLVRNALPHDLEWGQKVIRDTWASSEDDEQKERIASEFFTAMSTGRHEWYQWYAYLGGQRDGLLPANWDRRKKNIVIFTSSDQEFVAIDDRWKGPIYREQVEGLQRIVACLSAAPGNIHLYVRMHPGLKGIKNARTHRLLRLQADFVTVIPPEDPVSTYALMKSADTVLTFGSTTGIEAVFWGKPSILAGQSFYGNLGGTYNPSSHEELVELLRADLTPKPKRAAMMYGYWMNTFGTPFRHYLPRDLSEGQFGGHKISSPRWASLAIYLYTRSWRLRIFLNKVFALLARKRLTGRFRR